LKKDAKKQRMEILKWARRESMTDQYKSDPGWINDASMKKIDAAMEKGNLDEALKDIDDVLKQDLVPQKKAHAYVHKGAIYYRKAESMWNKAIEIYPDLDAKLNLEKIKTASTKK
jgi:tetratricopeptide (TPR) repeat protein